MGIESLVLKTDRRPCHTSFFCWLRPGHTSRRPVYLLEISEKRHPLCAKHDSASRSAENHWYSTGFAAIPAGPGM